MLEERIVIPNECEGSKISPCGRNDTEAKGQDILGVMTLVDQRAYPALLSLRRRQRRPEIHCCNRDNDSKLAANEKIPRQP